MSLLRYPQVCNAQLAGLFERFKRFSTSLGFSPDIGIRRAPHSVFFAIFPGCHTPAIAIILWREREDNEEQGALLTYDRMRACDGWCHLKGAIWEAKVSGI